MVEPLISLYQDGEASPAERQIVEQYLAVCAECRTLYQSFQQVESGLRAYLDNLPGPTIRPEVYPFLQEQTRPDRAANRPAPARPIKQTSPLRAAYPGLSQGGRFRLPGLSPFAFAGTIAAMLLVVMIGLFVMLANSRPPTPLGTDTAPVAIGSGSPEATQEATATATAAPSPAFTAAIIEPVTGNATTEAASTSIQSSNPAVVTQKPATTVANPAVPATTRAVQKTTPPKTSNPVVPTNTPIPPQGGGNPPTSVPNPTTSAATTTAATTTAAAATAMATPEPATATPVPATATTTKPAATPEPAQTAPANNQLLPASPSPAPKTTAASTEPVYSKAPGWIAYVDSSDAWIHLVHADGNDDQLFGDPDAFKNINWEQLVWSNDARWLAAVGLDKIKGQRGIYLLDIQNPRRIEYITDGIEPLWSPDSRFLTYLAPPVSVSGGVSRGRPAFYNLKKRTTVLISSQSDTFAPQWFDDSNRILVGQNSVYNLTSNSITQFKLPFTNDCVGDSLSPSGNKLAVLEQGTNGDFETVIYDLNKGQISDPKKPLLRIVPPFQGAIGKVCASERLEWTPDSKYVYYYSSNNPTYSTCLVQATNGNARCLTGVYEPSFTSDGSNLVDFSPSNGIGGLVYSMPTSLNARPPNLRVIAETRIPPAWQPR
jgi:anti-sigma factor RsiW